MTEKADINKKTEKKVLQSQKVKSKFSMQAVLNLFFIVLIIGLGATVYLGNYANTKYNSNIMNQIGKSDSALVKLSNQIDGQMVQISDMKNWVRHEIKRQQPSSNQWVLGESKYLIRLAEFSLHFQKDIPTAIAILQNAKSLVSNQGDIEYLSLRQSIERTILSLKEVESPNIADLMVQLDALNDAVPYMKIAPVELNVGQEGRVVKLADNSQPKQKTSWWKRGWEEVGAVIDRAVIIRHHGKKVMPLIEPKQEVFVVLNIQDSISQAQWAVLHGNQTLYDNSLNKVVNWVGRYFDSKDTATKAINEMLKKLSRQKVSVNMPSLEPIIAEINKLG